MKRHQTLRDEAGSFYFIGNQVQHSIQALTVPPPKL